MRAFELLEYRRAGDKFPKQAAIDVLKKYKDQDDVYISFTKIDKLGLNPQSEYDTPLGIYSYPLKAAYKNYNIEQDGISGFPFAYAFPYIWIFRGNIPDFSDITPQQYLEIKNELREKYGEEKIQEAAETIDELHKKNYGSQIWGLTWALTNTSIQWTKLLLNLGFNGISDKKGNGFIHTNEPCQAVFFTIKGLEILEKIKNNRDMKTPDEIEHIEKVKHWVKAASDEELDRQIRLTPKYIKYVKNPSEKLQIIAITNEPFCLKLIKNPTEKIKELAVSKNGLNIQHCKNPSELLQELAVRQNSHGAMILILKMGIIPSEKIIKLALSTNSSQAIISLLNKYNINFEPSWVKW
jgi:hypothetical protein